MAHNKRKTILDCCIFFIKEFGQYMLKLGSGQSTQAFYSHEDHCVYCFTRQHDKSKDALVLAQQFNNPHIPKIELYTKVIMPYNNTFELGEKIYKMPHYKTCHIELYPSLRQQYYDIQGSHSLQKIADNEKLPQTMRDAAKILSMCCDAVGIRCCLDTPWFNISVSYGNNPVIILRDVLYN